MEPRATRQLTFHGAVVTLVGLLAGIPYSMVATERILGSERAWRFAHVGNILGGLILIAVAGVVDRLDLAPARRTLVAWSLVLGAYADAVGIVAAARLLAGGRAPRGDRQPRSRTIALATRGSRLTRCRRLACAPLPASPAAERAPRRGRRARVPAARLRGPPRDARAPRRRATGPRRCALAPAPPAPSLPRPRRRHAMPPGRASAP